MKLIFILMLVGSAFAQAPVEPEMRGVVREFGTNAPIAGAEVAIYEFVVIDSTLTRSPIATAYADNRGNYAFKPGHIGRFFIEARRAGYSNARETGPRAMAVPGMGVSETIADLTEERKVSTTNLMLFRPGTLTGRVVDEDGNPVAKLAVTAIQPGITTPSLTANTDDDGNFTFTGLPASSRVIQIGPTSAQIAAVMNAFTEKDLEVVDQDFEISYWPGGVREPEQALPMQITPGATVSAGTLRARKVPYYRAHLKFDGECANENWVVMFPILTAPPTIAPNSRPAKCGKEILIRMVPAGAGSLAIVSSEGSSRKAALVPLNIRDENVEASFRFSVSEDIPVRILDRDGGQLPPFKNARLMLRSAVGYGPDVELVERGTMVVHVVLSRQQIVFSEPISNTAIHEIRYNRLPVADGVFDVVQGATLEIVLDQRPASLSFTGAAPGARILLARWPLSDPLALLPVRRPYTESRTADSSGKGQITALAEGEYRLIAIPDSITSMRNPQTLLEMLAKGEKITLMRGEQKNIEIKR